MALMATGDDVLDAFKWPGDKEKVLSLLSTVRVHPSTIRDGYNWTLLHWASYRGWPDICQFLVEKYQLDPHCRNSDGRTALHWACSNDNHEVVRYLVLYCCSDPLEKNNYGDTPLDRSSGESREFLQKIIDESKKQRFSNVCDYLEQRKAVAEAILAEAMSEGSGELHQGNMVFHGAPGAGKSSVKCLILGQPPRPKHKQNATDIMERSVRTVCVSRVATTTGSNKHLAEVDNNDIISRIAMEVEKHQKINETRGQLKRMEPVSRSNPQQDALINIIEATRTSVTVTDPVSQPLDDVQHLKDDQPTTDESKTTQAVIIGKCMTSQWSSRGGLGEELGVFDCRWLHHIDSGGQPQFHDVFPLLYNSPSHCVIVMRLTEGLDTRPKVRFYSKGNDEYCLPDYLVLSNREMIIRMCQIAQRITQATDGKFVPRVFIVGTHFDKVSFFKRYLLKCVKKINEQLAPIYKQYSNVMVSKSADEYIFPVNAMATDEERQQYTEELQKHIISATENSGKPVEVPLKWMTFHLEIDKVEEGVIRIPDCIKVGKQLKMTEEKVRIALEFLNRVALVLYYPDDVPNLVMTKIDPFTNRLSRLIKASFIPPDNGPAKECIELREKGLFRKSFLRRVFADLDESLLSDNEFLRLLVRLKIAVNIDGDLYFLPSALSLERPCKESFFKCQSNPCALWWNEHILPHGFFLTVSVEMQDKSEIKGGYVFELRTDTAQWREEIQFSEAKQKIPGVVKLTDRQRWIQVSYSGDKSYCPAIYSVVTSATQRAIKRLKHMGIGSPTIGCVCPLCPENEEDHFCYLSEDRRFMTCSANKSKTGPVTGDISCWFEGAFSQSISVCISKVNVTPDRVKETCVPVVPLKGESDYQERDTFPVAVFNRHTPELLCVVSDFESQLVADLTSAGVISEDDISSNGVSRCEGAEFLMDTVQSCLVKSYHPKKILVNFITVLNNQKSEALKKISAEIKNELMNLDHAPNSTDVFNLLKSKTAEWNDIGRELAVPFDKRQELLAQGVMSRPSSKLESVINMWVESECSPVTWRNLLKVLSELQFNDVIKSTEQFLLK